MGSRYYRNVVLYNRLLVPLFLLALIIWAGDDNPGGLARGLFTWVVFVAIWIALTPMLYRYSLRRRAIRKVRKGVLQEMGGTTLEIGPPGIHLTKDKWQAVYKWSMFEKVVAQPQSRFIFLMSERRFAIPKSSFADAAECDRFVALVNRYIQAAAEPQPQEG